MRIRNALAVVVLLGVGNLAPRAGFARDIGDRGGDAALAAIGGRLADVARQHGWTADQVRAELRHDARLRWDGRGLYYVEPGVAAPAVGVSPAAATVPKPLADTFLLHSKPGATRVVYLDFDGHNTSGTSWNSGRTDPIVSGPYDFDGNTAAFSDTERQRIQYIWARVADDFAPMDVDVTTEDPGVEALRRTTTSDAAYGVRVVISDTNWYNTGAGGVAYVGSFNWSSDTPCFVFADQLGNGHEKYVAEAASHEAGHTVGLSHDGTATTGYYQGQGNWAPIMGVGYYKPIVQWSKGEYSGANNTQDDLAVMASYGVVVRPDDVGDTPAAAQPLGTAGAGPVQATARIERRADKDVFSFVAGAGAVTVSVVPTNPHEPTLDAQARLLDGAGAQVAVSNPAGVGSPTISATVAAGTYYVEVDGVGEGDPLTTGYSDYASLGEYDVVVTGPSAVGQPPVAAATASPTSGVAPLTVTYSAAGSSDPDGTVTSYAWAFSDGSTSTLPTVSRTYNTAGTYTATLTVTDNDGNSSTANAPAVTVSPAVQTARISSLVVQAAGNRRGKATVTVLTTTGAPVVGATVQGTWTGALSGIQSAVTNSSGVATLTSARGRTGTATFTTSTVTVPSGFAWDGVNRSASATIR